MGANSANGSAKTCSMESCGEPAVAVLAKQALCMDHFVIQCYERFDEANPFAGKDPGRAHELAARMAGVEECSQQALRVCLSEKKLTNLERARLMDILLWAGELYIAARQREGTAAPDLAWDRWRPETLPAERD
jgi:hypothetical protein